MGQNKNLKRKKEREKKQKAQIQNVIKSTVHYLVSRVDLQDMAVGQKTEQHMHINWENSKIGNRER